MDLGPLACEDVNTHAYVSSQAMSSEGSGGSAHFIWAGSSEHPLLDNAISAKISRAAPYMYMYVF